MRTVTDSAVAFLSGPSELPTPGALVCNPATTPAPLAAIVSAQSARKVAALNDMELDVLLTSELLRAALRMGHKNALGDDKDALLIREDVAELLREKWHYLTENEIRIVFRLGSTGELKLKPDEVVFMSVATVAEWLRRYKYTTKPAAMEHARPFEAPASPLPEHHPARIAWKVTQIAEIVEAAIQGVSEHHDPGNCLYDWLKEVGAFKGFRSAQEYADMKAEETERLFRAPRSPQKDERNALRTFADALEMGNWPADHPLARTVANACKKRVLQEWVQDQVLEQNDVRADLTTLATCYYNSLPEAA